MNFTSNSICHQGNDRIFCILMRYPRCIALAVHTAVQLKVFVNTLLGSANLQDSTIE